MDVSEYIELGTQADELWNFMQELDIDEEEDELLINLPFGWLPIHQAPINYLRAQLQFEREELRLLLFRIHYLYIKNPDISERIHKIVKLEIESRSGYFYHINHDFPT